MTTVYYFRYYCPTEAAYKFMWGTTPPTNCPTDNAAIDPSTITVMQTVTTAETIVTDGSDGWYQSTSLAMGITGATGTYTQDYSWPCDILLWTAAIFYDSTAANDHFQIIVAPDTAIGYLTAICNSGSTTMTVSPTVLAFIQRGLNLALNDGVNKNQLGRVTAINTNTNIVTFETTTANTFAMYTPVYISIYMVRDFFLAPSIVSTGSSIKFAGKGLRGKTIPANTIVRFCYTNNSAVAKNMSIQMEYFLMG